MKNFTILFVITLLMFPGCKSKYRKAADEIFSKAGGTENMNAGKRSYHIDVPEGWTTETRTTYGVEYFYISAPKTFLDPNTSINIATEFMQNLNLEEYRDGTIKSIQNSIPSAKILSKGDITANGIKGAWYCYSMAPQGLEVTLVGYIFPMDGVAYNVTAGTQTKDAERYRALFDSVASSFKFDNP
ncbi:MAG: hypothetical protein DI535_07675 [Citrobacter freundii]|nr:MAG: hypothetical protein DI535_07675 [Citrobacter freundii]